MVLKNQVKFKKAILPVVKNDLIAQAQSELVKQGLFLLHLFKV